MPPVHFYSELFEIANKLGTIFLNRTTEEDSFKIAINTELIVIFQNN